VKYPIGSLDNYALLVALGGLAAMIARQSWPKLTRALIEDLRVPRILHFVALGGLGMALWLHDYRYPDWIIGKLAFYLEFALMVMALTYAAVFAIVTNNVEDLEADKISNPGRPLVRGAVEKGAYLRAGWISLALALLLAWFTNKALFVGVAGISLGYYVYSCKPFRLKRIPILAKLIIGVNSWIVAVTGYVMVGGTCSLENVIKGHTDTWHCPATWQDFPLAWSIFILVPLSLAANFVDLKDTEGDKATGIATLPVLLGEKWARHVIAAATVATYVMGGILLAIPWVWPLNAVACAAHMFFLYRKPYDERWVFLVYVGTILGLDFFLLWA
jgi:4-hydroxybenzoate polyprenyltransferase